MNGIPIYSEINDLHRLTGSKLRTTNPEFHCFDMEKANDLAVRKLAPHRVEFYTLALNHHTENLDYSLNDQEFKGPRHFLLCVAPGQVASWEKNGNWYGYCTFFKSEFLNFSAQVNFLQQYPFFNINETNLLPIAEEDFASFKLHYDVIMEEQSSERAFRDDVIRSSFQTILWKARRIYESVRSASSPTSANFVLAAQFQYLVNQHFLSKTAVEDYAEMLNITANYLSHTIATTLGRSAKTIITKRRMEEAKYLLKTTNSDVSEIAYYLNFREPTHFVKFFKKDTGLTPLAYRVDSSR